jgi:hypothetical protein
VRRSALASARRLVALTDDDRYVVLFVVAVCKNRRAA